jgi:hypothetical protein
LSFKKVFGRIFCTRCGDFRGDDHDVGVISMWSGELSELSSTWQLCDGTNGTPDLRDKFMPPQETTKTSTPAAINLRQKKGQSFTSVTEAETSNAKPKGNETKPIHSKLKLEDIPSHTHDRNSVKKRRHQYSRRSSSPALRIAPQDTRKQERQALRMQRPTKPVHLTTDLLFPTPCRFSRWGW